jgi:hypothetical protein
MRKRGIWATYRLKNPTHDPSPGMNMSLGWGIEDAEESLDDVELTYNRREALHDCDAIISQHSGDDN